MKYKIYALTISLISLSLTVFGQQAPIASFSISNQYGCVPQIVEFTNQSLGSNLSFLWDLGNGNTSTIENPQVIYSEAGTYTISLTVSNQYGNNSCTIETPIQIFAAPEINVENLGDFSGCVPFQSEFIASFNNPTDNVSWDFGDGNILEGQNQNYTFNQSGEYNLLITAIDAHGCFASKHIENIIEVFPLPEFNFSANQTNLCHENAEVSFSTDLNNPNQFSILWNFGDGEYSTESNPIHTYTDFGNYTVTCEIININTCSKLISKTDYIQIAPVNAEFTPADSLFCGTRTIQFQNLSSAYSYVEWDFGDGATSNMVNPQHEFMNVGSYDVIMHVWNDDGCEQTITHNIIIDKVHADFSVSQSSFCSLPAFVEYTSLCENAVSQEYHLGSGDIFDIENPINIITDSSMSFENLYYNVFSDTLIAMSALGCTDTLIVANSIEISIPKAYFYPNNLPTYSNQVRGCAPLTINFTQETEYIIESDEIVNIQWNFGDGTTSTEENPIHTWDNEGEFVVTMTVETANGCSSSYQAIIEVGTVQTANISLEIPDSICASDYIQLFDESSDSTLIDQWMWTFSDGGSSMNPNPLYHFADTGYMDVELVVGYNGCMSEPIQIENITYVNGPVAKFSYEYDCQSPLSYDFFAELIEADTWYWDLGDGTTGFENELNFSYTYAEAGNYQVRIIAENLENGCSYFYRRTLKPRKVKAILEINNTFGCPGLVVQADPTNSQQILPSEHNNLWGKYHWIIDNGVDEIVNNQILNYTFIEPGNHEIKLIVKDRNGCSDTTSKQITIYQPRGNIFANTQIGCAPLSVDFTSTINSDTTLSNYSWNFGDGMNSNEENPNHIYTTNGEFTPQITITDILGCQNTITYDDIITSIIPSANFTVENPGLCIGDEVTFNPEQTGDENYYQWNFGNGFTSELQNPEIPYNNSGSYNISLSIIDENGCSNQLTKENYISVQDYPTADFVADNTTANCYPFEVQFTETGSDNISEWYWDFGDSSIGGNVENPTHNFINIGDYDINLIVGTSNGCNDTILKENYIHVGGPYAEINIPDTVCSGTEVTMYISNSQNLYQTIWDMGNGQFITGDSITYIYNETGTQYPTVLLQTDDVHTCDKAFTDSIFIPTVIANFSTNGPLCIGESLIIENLSINADTYKWNYGESRDSSLTLSNHTYENSGYYTISLLAQKHFENGLVCSDISEQEITIHPSPVSDFTFNIENQNNCELPKKVDFTNNCIDATSYEWQFTNENKDDRSNSSCETNPTHIYDVAGNFNITLICYNEFGCSDKSTQPITINPEIHANFDIPISAGCEPLTTTLTNTSLSNSENIEDPIISWDWDLGEGIHSNEENPTSTFSHGFHNISLIIETENGCRDTITKDSALIVYRTPKASFVLEGNDDNVNPENYGEIQFMNTSGGGTSPYQSNWDFDDGNISNEVSPIHRYSSNTSYLGEAYQPELIVSDANGCSDTIRQKITMDYFNGLFVPNAMAMDYGNGEQKVFMPKGKSLIKYHLTIYDRFGNKLFETSAINSEDGSPMEAWDGKTDEGKAEEGVYVWKIDATFSDGSTWNYKTKTGKTTNTGTFLVLR